MEDKDLIIEYLHGDEKSLEALIAKYLKPVYGFVYGYANNPADAQDITQETFLKMWRNIKKFDREKNFKSWLFSIAKNASIDFLRKRKTVPFSSFEGEEGYNPLMESLTDPSLSSWDMAAAKEKRAEIDSAKKKIPEKYQKVVYLYNDKDMNFREISEFLGESINTVKSRYKRALAQLKLLLEPDGFDKKNRKNTKNK
ncbi:MAG: RNA polymerase sigma factor [Candidatus Paceibacterota bacterium]|jgi:RNA polymerase sigma-70 factor (ECF subfamily)